MADEGTDEESRERERRGGGRLGEAGGWKVPRKAGGERDIRK